MIDNIFTPSKYTSEKQQYLMKFVNNEGLQNYCRPKNLIDLPTRFRIIAPFMSFKPFFAFHENSNNTSL